METRADVANGEKQRMKNKLTSGSVGVTFIELDGVIRFSSAI